MKRDMGLGISIALLGLVLFLGANGFRRPRLIPDIQMSVVAPIPLQVIAAFGDRFLASNFAVWRVLMTGGENMPRESLAALARVQEDASFLNPGHEDNYVMATALLPWEGFVEQTQTILRRATEIRKDDVYAPYFYGFNQIHFLGDAKGAFDYGRIAASHAPDEGTRQALTVISAAWLERGNDPALAERVISVLAGELKDPRLKAHLMQRARRQQIVLWLQQSVDSYANRRGVAPRRLEQLVDDGSISEIPVDPVGTVEFIINSSGRVTFRPKTGK